jgi:CheY-like chemotaxis protein
MRILIVEDDPGIHEALADDLRHQHRIVDVAEEGKTGLEYARTGVYGIISLDAMLPGIDGLEIYGHGTRCHLPARGPPVSADASIVVVVEFAASGDALRARKAARCVAAAGLSRLGEVPH